MSYTAEERRRRLAHILDHLRAQGGRIHAQREEIVRALLHRDDHPSAADLYEELHGRFPTLSLATVYKALDRLRDLGEVFEFTVAGINRYEGMRARPHAHLVCRRCGTVSDAHVGGEEAPPEDLIRSDGFHVEGAHTSFTGLCRSCSSGDGAHSSG